MVIKKHKSKTGYVIAGKHLHAFIKRAIKEASPHAREICGLLVSHGHTLELAPTRNETKQPLCFEIGARSVREIQCAARRRNRRVVGSFHSHPCSGLEPGESDILGAWDGTLMLVIGCGEKKARLWLIKDNAALPVSLRCVPYTRAEPAARQAAGQTGAD